MEQRAPQRITADGFTLVELVVVIVITGIVAALGGMLISSPIQGYIDLSRRAELVDAADNSLHRMQRDIRQALPNSIRVSTGGLTLELLHTVDGGRYRAQGPGNILDFAQAADSDFDVLGELDDDPIAGQQLVVYNIAASESSGNAYSGDNRREIVAGAVGVKNFVNFTPTLAPFPFQSPYQRFFLVDQAVSYVCTPSLAGGTLMRYAGYAITDPQPTSGLGTGSLLANHVTACAFTYTGGSSQRAGLVMLQLTLADQGEAITLLQQTHVDNAP